MQRNARDTAAVRAAVPVLAIGASQWVESRAGSVELSEARSDFLLGSCLECPRGTKG